MPELFGRQAGSPGLVQAPRVNDSCNPRSTPPNLCEHSFEIIVGGWPNFETIITRAAKLRSLGYDDGCSPVLRQLFSNAVAQVSGVGQKNEAGRDVLVGPHASVSIA